MNQNEHIDNIYNVNNIKNANSSVHPDGVKSLESIRSFNDLIGVPTWSTYEFLKHRMNFATQAKSKEYIFAEPGTYFYKAFFNFGSGYGLLGGIIKDINSQQITDQNTAWQFLTNNSYSDRFSQTYKDNLRSKRYSLEKFCKLLNYISEKCPWFIKSIENLEDATTTDLIEIAKKDSKYIQLNFNEDALDMRVSTLFDLYKDACYDLRNLKEVIPENLRKFDMTILTFNPPIVDLNISRAKNESYANYSLKSIDTENTVHGFIRMKPYDLSKSLGITYRALILKNCEFDLSSLKSFTGTLTNDKGFKQEKSVKVNFDRSYVVNINNELDARILEGAIGKVNMWY